MKYFNFEHPSMWRRLRRRPRHCRWLFVFSYSFFRRCFNTLTQTSLCLSSHRNTTYKTMANGIEEKKGGDFNGIESKTMFVFRLCTQTQQTSWKLYFMLRFCRDYLSSLIILRNSLHSVCDFCFLCCYFLFLDHYISRNWLTKNYLVNVQRSTHFHLFQESFQCSKNILGIFACEIQKC